MGRYICFTYCAQESTIIVSQFSDYYEHIIYPAKRPPFTFDDALTILGADAQDSGTDITSAIEGCADDLKDIQVRSTRGIGVFCSFTCVST